MFYDVVLVISQASGLKIVVQTLYLSLKSIGPTTIICCIYFVIFGILGVQVIERNPVERKSLVFIRLYQRLRRKFETDIRHLILTGQRNISMIGFHRFRFHCILLKLLFLALQRKILLL